MTFPSDITHCMWGRTLWPALYTAGSRVQCVIEWGVSYCPRFFRYLCFWLLNLTSPHFNTNMCTFYSWHFQNRLVTLAWMHLRGINSYFYVASLLAAFPTSQVLTQVQRKVVLWVTKAQVQLALHRNVLQRATFTFLLWLHFSACNFLLLLELKKLNQYFYFYQYFIFFLRKSTSRYLSKECVYFCHLGQAEHVIVWRIHTERSGMLMTLHSVAAL